MQIMTREEVIQEINEIANDCNLTFDEAALEAIVMFYDAAGFDSKAIEEEFADKTTNQLIKAYMELC